MSVSWQRCSNQQRVLCWHLRGVGDPWACAAQTHDQACEGRLWVLTDASGGDATSLWVPRSRRGHARLGDPSLTLMVISNLRCSILQTTNVQA